MQAILIVDDHNYMRQALREVLEDLFPAAKIREAATVAEARESIQQMGFNLAIVDLSLPDGSGIDLIGEIAAVSPLTYLVVASIHDDDQHLFDALRAGTHGYLLKDLPRAELRGYLQGIVNGQPPLSPSIARRILRYFRSPPPPSPSGSARGLTGRETDILVLIAKGLTRGEAAQALQISSHTAADHIRNVYQKLDIHSRAEAALHACRLGLIQPGDGP